LIDAGRPDATTEVKNANRSFCRCSTDTSSGKVIDSADTVCESIIMPGRFVFSCRYLGLAGYRSDFVIVTSLHCNENVPVRELSEKLFLAFRYHHRVLIGKDDRSFVYSLLQGPVIGVK